MAGAFTHSIICDVAKRKRSSIGLELWQLLNKQSQFLFLGAASPDLPYLSLKTGKVNWADVMHYERTNSIVASGYDDLKKAWPSKTDSEEIKLAWLLGYVSHLVADATIHPIVQAIVGPYESNKDGHRICEMTQDSLVFNAKKNNDITYAEFSGILKYCNASTHFNNLMDFWKKQILYNYHKEEREPPPNLWFKTYTEAVDIAEGGSGPMALFRHLGIGASYIYKSKGEIVKDYLEDYQKYFQSVKLPHNDMGSFMSSGFDYAVGNVVTVWSELYSALSSSTVEVPRFIKNWNLDTGVDVDSPNQEVTYWM